MSESKYARNVRYYGGNGIVIVEADGDLQCAHFSDFAYVQESVCAFGGTAIDAVANLALTMRDISKAMQAGFNAAPELLAAYRRIYADVGIRECLPFDGIDALLRELATALENRFFHPSESTSRWGVDDV